MKNMNGGKDGRESPGRREMHMESMKEGGGCLHAWNPVGKRRIFTRCAAWISGTGN